MPHVASFLVGSWSHLLPRNQPRPGSMTWTEAACKTADGRRCFWLMPFPTIHKYAGHDGIDLVYRPGVVRNPINSFRRRDQPKACEGVPEHVDVVGQRSMLEGRIDGSIADDHVHGTKERGAVHNHAVGDSSSC